MEQIDKPQTPEPSNGKYTYSVFIALLFALVFFMLRSCEYERKLQDSQSKLSVLTSKGNGSPVSVGKDKDGNTTYDQKQNESPNTKIVRDEIKDRSGLKDGKVLTVVKVETRIDTVFIPFQAGNSSDLYKRISYKDSGFYFYGRVDSSGLFMDSVGFPVTLKYAIGKTKKGFFKPTESVVRVSLDNRYAKVTGMENIVVKDSKKWYQKPLTVGLIGFGAGFVTYSLVKK